MARRSQETAHVFNMADLTQLLNAHTHGIQNPNQCITVNHTKQWERQWPLISERVISYFLPPCFNKTHFPRTTYRKFSGLPMSALVIFLLPSFLLFPVPDLLSLRSLPFLEASMDERLV